MYKTWVYIAACVIAAAIIAYILPMQKQKERYDYCIAYGRNTHAPTKWEAGACWVTWDNSDQYFPLTELGDNNHR